MKVPSTFLCLKTIQVHIDDKVFKLKMREDADTLFCHGAGTSKLHSDLVSSKTDEIGSDDTLNDDAFRLFSNDSIEQFFISSVALDRRSKSVKLKEG